MTSHTMRAELRKAVRNTTNLRWNYHLNLFTSSGGYVAVTNDFWKVWSLQIMTSCSSLLPLLSYSLSPTPFPFLFLSHTPRHVFSSLFFIFLCGLGKVWKKRSTSSEKRWQIRDAEERPLKSGGTQDEGLWTAMICCTAPGPFIHDLSGDI